MVAVHAVPIILALVVVPCSGWSRIALPAGRTRVLMQVEAPGLAENEKFSCHPSVLKWQSFQKDGAATATENLRDAASIVSGIFQRGGSSYAAAHGLRTGYFLTNAAAGTLASNIHERLRGDSAAGASGPAMPALTATLDTAVVTRLLLEAAMTYEQDYEAIDAQEYRTPWDMATLAHRQYSPQYALRQTFRFVNEAVGTLGRRNRQATPGVWLDAAPALYPDYYRNDFHYQTDGWFSSRSAAVYETSTETLFVGRQDAMQRQSLRPLLPVAKQAGGAPRVLEVACGTGRFATFIRDNLPDAALTATDLSPFYLEAARENDEYWRRTRFADKAARPPAAAFVQAAAESLPFADGAFDAVVCVYLFHEMPEAARASAAAEFARVCAPGGIVVLTDSMQRGDRPALDAKLGNFGKMNEPHYDSYIGADLPAFFEAAGLLCESKWVASSTKTLSFRKPEAEAEPAVEAPAEAVENTADS
jgi:ubiquinone/menaquinone biosynthesis C-methylase UbiE